MARGFATDLSDVGLNVLDAAHLALEPHGQEITDLIRDFLHRIHLPRKLGRTDSRASRSSLDIKRREQHRKRGST